MIKRLVFLLVVALSGAWLTREFVTEGVWVASNSMEPTLRVGTHYFVNKLAYRFGSPKRGEIVVFTSPVDPEKGLIKRILAVGGDTVEMRAKQVYLNGALLSEPYAVYKRAGERLAGDTMELMTVPPNSFFILGDNRDESEDATVWRDPQTGQPVHFVRKDQIQGRLYIP